jgi:DNA modification methylase
MTIQIHHGDCMGVLADMPDNSVDLIVTDPPYRVVSGGSNSELARRSTAREGNNNMLAKNDGRIFDHNDIKPTEYLPELYRVLRPGRDAYVMTNNITLLPLLTAAKEAGFKFHGLLVWVKNNSTPNRWYLKNLELTCYFYKPPARAIRDMGSKQAFFCNNVPPRDKQHPTQKPLALMDHYIRNSSDEGWIVFDPFMGSGSTGVAAVQAGRKFIGVEKSPEYFAVAENRLYHIQPSLLEAAE